tara:strand:- start:193 stop:378 length:186 start_codon:yes stop_codon:yes gene_type:complete
MSMSPVPRTKTTEENQLVQEFLAKGGEITQCAKGARTEDINYTGGFYAKRRKKKEAETKQD